MWSFFVGFGEGVTIVVEEMVFFVVGWGLCRGE